MAPQTRAAPHTCFLVGRRQHLVLWDITLLPLHRAHAQVGDIADGTTVLGLVEGCCGRVGNGLEACLHCAADRVLGWLVELGALHCCGGMLPRGVQRWRRTMRVAVAGGLGGRGARCRQDGRVNERCVNVDLGEELLEVLIQLLGLWADMPVVGGDTGTERLDAADAAGVAFRVG